MYNLLIALEFVTYQSIRLLFDKGHIPMAQKGPDQRRHAWRSARPPCVSAASLYSIYALLLALSASLRRPTIVISGMREMAEATGQKWQSRSAVPKNRDILKGHLLSDGEEPGDFPRVKDAQSTIALSVCEKDVGVLLSL